MKLWCFDDVHHWGQMLVAAAAKRGIDARLFDDPRQPEDGYVFMHMHHHPQVRTFHKRVMAILAMNPAITLIPSYRASVLFDDKLEQARQFARWMPRTRVFYTPGAARRFIEALPASSYPIVSKSQEGTSSHNVRLIADAEEAKTEIRQAFSDLGIKTRFGQCQRGYLLWQDFIPDCDGDLRVIAIGTKRLMLRRLNRADAQPPVINSGSSRIVPVQMLDKDLTDALTQANAFFDEERIKWGALDMVFDQRAAEWKMLEYTVSWTMHAYHECAFIDTMHYPSKVIEQRGADVWDALLGEIEAGEFINGF